MLEKFFIDDPPYLIEFFNIFFVKSTILLTSKIECNIRSRKNNELVVVYPKTIKNNKNSKNNTYPETIVTLKCNY